MEPLTGRAAFEALAVYTRLGNTDARFDAGRVRRAVSLGVRVFAAARTAIRVLPQHGSRGRRMAPRRRAFRPAYAAATSRDRPAGGHPWR